MNHHIIEEIKQQLTKDKETDVNFLQTQIQYYRLMGNEEVVYALTALLFGYLDQETKKQFDIKAHAQLAIRQKQYELAVTSLNHQEFEKARTILLQLVATYEKASIIATNRFYDFEEMIEYFLFVKTVENAKVSQIKRYPEPVVYMYYLLAEIAMEQQSLHDALTYYKQALVYNPLSMYVMEAMMEVYVTLQDQDNIFMLAKTMLQYAYTKAQFAYIYRILGASYEQKAAYDIAIACYAVSNHYQKQEQNQEAVKRITAQNGYISFQTIDDIFRIFAREQIAYGPSKAIIQVFEVFIPYTKSIHDMVAMHYLLEMASELTGSPYYLNQQIALERQMNQHEKK